MIPVALKLILGGLWKRLLSAFAWIGRNPWPAACIASVCLSLWLWHGKHSAEAQRDQWHRAHDLRVEAEKVASAAQKAMNARIQTTYQETADVAQERHDARSAGVQSATRDFVLARRLQPGQCAPSGGNSAPIAGSAEVPQDAPASPVLVAVEQRDVETCAADYAYARSAYEWADSLIKSGVAK